MGANDCHTIGADTGMTPSCTVVICTRDRPELLDRCLDAVAKLTYPQPIDVLVVDNAPSDRRTYEVAMRKSVRYVVEPAVGLSRARNRGARECSSDVIAYVDDDAVPETDWLSALATEFNDPRVMAATGAILPFDAVAAGLGKESELPEGRSVDRDNLDWFEIANFGGLGIGANMAFRRSVFERWPGFDVRLGRGQVLNTGEEDYAFFTLIERGFRVSFTPAARVYHDTTSNNLVEAAVYLTFLWFEERRYRPAMMRFIRRSAMSSPHAWRPTVGSEKSQTQSRLQKVAATLRGFKIYLQFRLATFNQVATTDRFD